MPGLCWEANQNNGWTEQTPQQANQNNGWAEQTPGEEPAEGSMATLDPLGQHTLLTTGWDSEPQLSSQWETLQRKTRAKLGAVWTGAPIPDLCPQGRRLSREK